jgi:hypothetical protein
MESLKLHTGRKLTPSEAGTRARNASEGKVYVIAGRPTGRCGARKLTSFFEASSLKKMLFTGCTGGVKRKEKPEAQPQLKCSLKPTTYTAKMSHVIGGVSNRRPRGAHRITGPE